MKMKKEHYYCRRQECYKKGDVHFTKAFTKKKKTTANVECKSKVVIMGATRTISKSSKKKCLSNIPGKYEIKGLQKRPYWALHTHTHTHTARSTDVKIQNIQHGK